ncbi:helicase [Seminavis robusta]|uniref:Helicase n=1 Tax=Seminavis robusta TaxID=568900 RepID=A0A9N8ELD7_9STRA|nr:helicase [Seminavis robusta]|eukprot:Sro1473_g275610.1 helicase (385) ;mRNA; f:12053-13207
MMTPLGNDCYQQQAFAIQWQMDNNGGLMPNMGRRPSMQHVPFMDFSFFPIRDEAAAANAAAAANSNPNKAPQQQQHVAMDTTTMNSVMANNFVGQFQQQQQQQQQQPLFQAPQVVFQTPSVAAVDPPGSSGVYHQHQADDISEGSDPVSEPSLAVVSMDGSEHSSSSKVSVSEGSSLSDSQRFKPFHEEKWSLRYKELLEFHKANGHAGVPHTYPKNPQLARWVKRQRRQFKLKKEGKPSTMTTERLDLLDSVGFIWDSHDLNWREKLDALTEFKRTMGHCNVPSNFRDKKLATWVKCQRRQYKLYWDGKPSAMSLNRIAALEKVGFEWEIRTTANKNGSASNKAATASSSSMMDKSSEPLPVHVPSTIGCGEQLFLAKAIASL